jgi:hypothetical protein
MQFTIAIFGKRSGRAGGVLFNYPNHKPNPNPRGVLFDHTRTLTQTLTREVCY